MPTNNYFDRESDHENELPASDAARKYEVNYNTLLSWIKKGEVQVGGNSGHRKTVNLDSLMAQLEKKGILKSPPKNEANPTSRSSVVPTETPGMPSLRDHHVGKAAAELINSDEESGAEAALPPRHHRPPRVRNHSKAKSIRKSNSTPTPTFPLRVTMRQIKGAISVMNLDELNHLRKWLADRLDQKLNS